MRKSILIWCLFSLSGLPSSHAEVLLNSADFTTFQAAVTAASGKTLGIARTEILAANLTIPGDVHLMFFKGGTISTSSGSKLTINCPVTAPIMQIFSGFAPGKVIFGPQSVTKVYPQWWGAKADGYTDDRNAVQCAIDSNCGYVHLPRGGYKLGSTLNITNRGNKALLISGDGYTEGRLGTYFYFNIDMAIDCTGSGDIQLQDFNLEAGPSAAIGILYGPSTLNEKVENNTLRNVQISMPSNPSANSGNGAAGVYNCGSGNWYGRNLYITVDNAVVLSGGNIFNISSHFAQISSSRSINNVTIDGASTLRSLAGASAIISNANQIKIPTAYLSGWWDGSSQSQCPYSVKITGSEPCSEIFISGQLERVGGGWLWVDNTAVNGLYINGNGVPDPNSPLIFLSGASGSITNGRIFICHMWYPSGNQNPVDIRLISAPGTGGGIKNITMQLYNYQKIDVPQRDFAGNIILAQRDLITAKQCLNLNSDSSYVLLASDNMEIVGLENMPVSTCATAIAAGYKLPGDLNNDCYVNYKDITEFALGWLICNNPSDPGCNTF